jgi:hypothetical protein
LTPLFLSRALQRGKWFRQDDDLKICNNGGIANSDVSPNFGEGGITFDCSVPYTSTIRVQNVLHFVSIFSRVVIFKC